MGMKPEAVLTVLIQADTRQAQAQLRKVQEQLDQMSVRCPAVRTYSARRERLKACGCIVLALIVIALVVVLLLYLDSFLIPDHGY